jgi:hypothetical protein
MVIPNNMSIGELNYFESFVCLEAQLGGSLSWSHNSTTDEQQDYCQQFDKISASEHEYSLII